MLGALGRLNDLTSSIIYRPLEEDFGSFYGGLGDFAAYIRSHHGSAVEPRPRMSDDDRLSAEPLPWSASYEMTDLFRADLPALKAAVTRLAPERVRLLITPLPKRWEAPQGLRNRVTALRELLDSLDLDERSLLDMPGYLPSRQFSVETHLHESSVAGYTRRLAEALD